MGRDVETISAFLFHRGGHDDPERLEANARKSFQGSIVLGMGFTFDDTDRKGVATPLAEMHRLIQENPGNGGCDLSRTSAVRRSIPAQTHAHHRYVINFQGWPLRRSDLSATWRERGRQTRSRDWRRDGICPSGLSGSPWRRTGRSLLAIVEEKGQSLRRQKSEDDSKSSHGRRASIWWQLYHQAKELYAAIESLDRVLVINCGATPHSAFAFLPSANIFANTLAVFPFETYAAFCALQSRPHEIWARFFGSSMKDDLRYTPSDCFETFPFPENWELRSALEAAGEAYYDYRVALMVENDEGLTKTYNRFHDPDDSGPRTARLRELHAAMDRVALDAYGWTDIPTDCEFLLDYEIDEETWGKKKKPWRYRWPDEVRDDVLARLLALNAQRAAEEHMAGSGVRLPAGSARVAL